MGLDGISVNQLRITPEFNSQEINSAVLNASNEVKAVDGLSGGQRVDPDKESGHDNHGEEFGNENREEEAEAQEDNIIKYDLSDSSKYIVKLDESSNNILIIEKSGNNVIQVVNAEELSKLVAFASNSSGSIINKSF